MTILLLLLFGLHTGLEAPKVQEILSTLWLGAIERNMMGVFLLWVVVLDLILLQKRKVPATMMLLAICFRQSLDVKSFSKYNVIMHSD